MISAMRDSFPPRREREKLLVGRISAQRGRIVIVGIASFDEFAYGRAEDEGHGKVGQAEEGNHSSSGDSRVAMKS
jgi:hypothetical protein